MIFKIQDLLFSQTITSYNGIYREVLIYAKKKKKKKIEKNIQTIFKKKYNEIRDVLEFRSKM